MGAQWNLVLVVAESARLARGCELHGQRGLFCAKRGGHQPDGYAGQCWRLGKYGGPGSGQDFGSEADAHEWVCTLPKERQGYVLVYRAGGMWRAVDGSGGGGAHLHRINDARNTGVEANTRICEDGTFQVDGYLAQFDASQDDTAEANAEAELLTSYGDEARR